MVQFFEEKLAEAYRGSDLSQSKNKLTELMDEAFPFIQHDAEATRDGIGTFSEALFRFHRSLAEDPQHYRDADSFLKAVGESRLQFLRTRQAGTERMPELNAMLSTLKRIDREYAVRDNLGELVAGNNRLFAVLDPSEASYSGQFNLEFLLEPEAGGLRQLMARTDNISDSLGYAGYLVARKKSTGELYLIETDDNGVESRYARLSETDILESTVRAVVDNKGGPQFESGTLPDDDYDKGRIYAASEPGSDQVRMLVDIRTTDTDPLVLPKRGLLVDPRASSLDVIDAIDSSRRFVSGRDAFVSGRDYQGQLYSSLDRNQRPFTIYVSPDYRAAKGAEQARQGRLDVAFALDEFLRHTAEGRALHEILTNARFRLDSNGKLVRPEHIGDIDGLNPSGSTQPIPESTKLLLVLTATEPDTARQVVPYDGQRTLTTVRFDPEFAGRGGQLNQATAVYSRLVSAAKQVAPTAMLNHSLLSVDDQTLENRVRHQLGLPQLAFDGGNGVSTDEHPRRIGFRQVQNGYDSSIQRDGKVLYLAASNSLLNGEPLLRLSINQESRLELTWAKQDNGSYAKNSHFRRAREIFTETLAAIPQNNSWPLRVILNEYNRRLTSELGSSAAEPYRLLTDKSVPTMTITHNDNNIYSDLSHHSLFQGTDDTADLTLPYQSVGDPGSGLNRLLPEQGNYRPVLLQARYQASLLADKIIEKRVGPGNDAYLKSLLTQFLYQQFESALDERNLSVHQPLFLSGAADAVTGVLEQSDVAALKAYINSLDGGYETFEE